jgi:hypothetical protein
MCEGVTVSVSRIELGPARLRQSQRSLKNGLLLAESVCIARGTRGPRVGW